MYTVPDFFQDESEAALRSQVDWQERILGLENSFFARFLRENPDVIAAWRDASTRLPEDKERVLRDWWQTVLHLLAFRDFDEGKVRSLLEQKGQPGLQGRRSIFSPPWSASSLKEYLEVRGATAIAEVERWVELFRFGDPYTLPHLEDLRLPR